MSPFALLWAAGGENLIKLLVVLLFILVPAIGQLITKWRGVQQEAAKRAQHRGQAPGGGQRPRNAVDDEIGEFLRRATQRRAEGAAPSPRSPAGPAPRAPTLSARPLAPPGESEVRVEVVREGGVGSGVGQHVQEYLKTEEIVEHAAHLGAEVTEADERFEQHLHQTFDHELSRLGHFAGESISSTSETSAQARGEQGAGLSATAAAGFAALLSNAQTIRQAVILNEILQRPEDRWA